MSTPTPTVNESSPLLGLAAPFLRHMSMQKGGDGVVVPSVAGESRYRRRRNALVVLLATAALCTTAAILVGGRARARRHREHQSSDDVSPPADVVTPPPPPRPPQVVVPTVPIERAVEHTQVVDRKLDGTDLTLWYRTWGNRMTGTPVLFVHGGPGNAIADYGLQNSEFFDYRTYFVVEVDQRGTGRSRPSVRDSAANMKYYADISIDKMSADFEVIRESLGIDKWLVFGGSWGSTLGLHYTTHYPQRCLGVILRGIFLDTKPEFDAVYQRRRYVTEAHLDEFDAFYDLAVRVAAETDEEIPDPDDSEAIVRLYSRAIDRGDRDAVWNWHVFEWNMMEEDPENMLDPDVIVEEIFPEARSVAFFESTLFLRGTFEEPVLDLLGGVDGLLQMNGDDEGGDDGRGGAVDKGGNEDEDPVRTWICQGLYDRVCPQQYARQLVDALEAAEVPHVANFVESMHEAGSPVMSACLKAAVDDFEARHVHVA